MKAQAIAARTYAIRKHYDAVIMDDTSNYQAYRAALADSSPRSVNAVRNTAGQVLMYEGQVIQAYYSNSNGGQTKRTDQVWSAKLPYYKSRDDPWDRAARAMLEAQGKTVKVSHGVGLSQIGADYAAQIGEDCEDILAFYYPGAVVAVCEEQEDAQMTDYPITVDMHTQNDCYKAARVRKKTHVIVHSTATKGVAYLPRWQQWNTPGFAKCAHTFVDWNGIYQTLPWNYQGWLNGVQAGNDCSVAFEICEPLAINDTPGMASDLYAKTAFLCVHLCQMFNIPAANVICHAEAYKLGLANNHSDVNHWWGKPGTAWAQYTMDRLRADVADALNPITYPYVARVETKASPLNIWNKATTNTADRITLARVTKGDTLTVTGRAGLAGWYAVQKDGASGFADGQYLAKIANSVPGDVPMDDEGMETFSVVIPDVDASTVARLLDAYAGAYVLGVNG